MTKTSHRTRVREDADREDDDRGADVMDAIGDTVERTADSWGRVTKAVVNGVADVTITSIDAITDIVCRSTGAARDRSGRKRTTTRGERPAGGMVRDFADFLADTAEIVSDNMTRSARSVQRAADRFSREADKESAPSTAADRETAAAAATKP